MYIAWKKQALGYIQGMQMSPDTNPYKLEFSDYQKVRGQFWDQINSSLTHSWGGYYQKRLAHIYQNIVPNDCKVLELGCREGALLHALKPSLGVGVDFSEPALAKARKCYPHLQFICADAHELNLERRAKKVNEAKLQKTVGLKRGFLVASNKVVQR